MTLEEQFGEYDYVNDEDRGAQNLHEWIKHSPNIKALVNSVTPEIQELHDAQKDVYTNINIFDAVGTQLDDIFGTLLGLERGTGQTDEDYRQDLLSRSSILSRSGEITAMKSVYKNLSAASLVSLFEQNPASFSMEANVLSIPSDEGLAKIRASLTELKQGGNTMLLSITDSATPFTLGTGSPELGLTGTLTTTKRWNGGEFGHEKQPFTLGSDGALSPFGLSGDYLSVENIEGGTLSKGF